MLNHKGTQEIKTERLLLRRFVIDDYIDMFIWASNPEVTKYLSYHSHKSAEDTKKLLELWVKYYDNNATYNWAIEYNNKVIGNISVVEQNENECELGWQIDVLYWNKGIMTEAAKAVADYLFGVGFEKIISGHDTRNIGSGRVMQKIGMTKVGKIHNYVLDKDGRIFDKARYEITKEEWIKGKEKQK